MISLRRNFHRLCLYKPCLRLYASFRNSTVELKEKLRWDALECLSCWLCWL
jgi:hypothetical protein